MIYIYTQTDTQCDSNSYSICYENINIFMLTVSGGYLGLGIRACIIHPFLTIIGNRMCVLTFKDSKTPKFFPLLHFTAYTLLRVALDYQLK